jgi:hypothetical protein
MRLLFFLLIITIPIISCDEIDFLKTSSEKDNSKEIYDGVRKSYIKGKLASTVTYKDSLKNGPAVNYYPDGKINMKFNYKDNKKNGPYTWYYKNGKVYLEGNYKNNEKDGVFKMYRENGKLKSEMPWHDGKPCVGLKEYFDSGNLKPVPKIIVKHKNTIKLDNKYVIELKLSDNNNYVDFYDASLGDNESFSDHFMTLPKENGTATITYFLIRGELIMKTITVIAKIKTRDKNIYILKKKINLSIEHR